ncbi:outer membrane lipoprotein carrier protein LolA [Cytobacillus solani]|uniref:Sporulation protein n=1 Tax=Cytobacillus solani TaxID=1637975 RepID=A0A0Q3VFG5_9BACI|nr:outer membrane lipoprotein carrier protein LolA [Cytobacillus solani]KOP79579.1 sporulation protein [Bacillus sp. FJAT-21945]KQL17627.1 sporulation protein [Cytobacillus solani]USK55491.1 outer membrane lipoprotein carrier protein LolA [Cytobacillus solani]
MRRKWLMLLAGLLIVIALSACGTKSQEDVTKELSGKLEEIKSYKANAKMTLQMGTEPQTYDIEVWHKDPMYYKVDLKNAQKDQSQMILRNDEGVFVLTPALNKSFKFQSEWPKNSSQAYLYESLINDIIDDKEATFKATKQHYIFETKTKYQNNQMLPTQEITLKKSDLSPVSVKVMDTDKNALVTVEFTGVKFNTSLDKKDFDMKKNMTSAQLEVPVMGEVADEEFSVKYPTEYSEYELIDQKEIKTENGKRVVLTYDGEKSFTLIQEKAEVRTASSLTSVSGDPVDLGFTIGALSNNTITWTHQGVDYLIASNDLTDEELTAIARSVQGNTVK